MPVPELPSFGISKAITRERTDDASKHQNKIRNFPHEPGNWATYVYIPIEETFELSDYIEELSKALSDFDLKINNDYHVSLTRTVVLKYHWIPDFVKTVQACMDNVNSFLVSFSGLKVYVNDTKTRIFIGLQVQQGASKLGFITSELDKCLMQYKLPIFYTNPSFHFSILWKVGDFSYEKLNEAVNDLSDRLKNFTFVVKVNHCECTSGNKHYVFPFKK